MSAIEATSVRVQTMADDTLRLVVDIEPRFAQAAFALFGKAGQPMALAALKVARSDAKPVEPQVPIGPLAYWAVLRCREERFREWIALMTMANASAVTELEAKNRICRICNIESRKELDTNKAAALVFKEKFMLPYADWLKKQEISA